MTNRTAPRRVSTGESSKSETSPRGQPATQGWHETCIGIERDDDAGPLERNMTTTTHSTLGDLILAVYEEMLTIYGDEDIASVAAAAIINDMISRPGSAEELEEAA